VDLEACRTKYRFLRRYRRVLLRCPQVHLVALQTSESLRSLSESTFSQRRVDVPWALFPYFFDLLPAVDGIPCDGLLMISRLVGLMNQHGFKLRKASRCPHSDAATIIELHGIVSERDWKRFEEMIWVWGIAVMSSRVPLELSPHRSLILEMVS